MRSNIRAAAAKVFGVSAIRGTAFALAAARRRSLILVYHRVLPDTIVTEVAARSVVPCVSESLFAAQLAALRSVGTIVPLNELLRSSQYNSPRLTAPRFSITLDDDEPSHLTCALPILRTLDVPATFFLSGRALHDLAPPWWIALEAEVARSGVARSAECLGVTATTLPELAATVESAKLVARVLERFAPALPEQQLQRNELRALAVAPSVSVGFHTLSHPVLTDLDEIAVRDALRDGRDTLEALADAPVKYLAYPHGKTSRRVAELARGEGYELACRSAGRPVDAHTDAMWMSRWEPGPMHPHALLSNVALRLSLFA